MILILHNVQFLSAKIRYIDSVMIYYLLFLFSEMIDTGKKCKKFEINLSAINLNEY